MNAPKPPIEFSRKKTLGFAVGLAGLGLATLGIAQPAQAFTIFQGGYGAQGNANSPVTFSGTDADTARNNFVSAANGLGNTTIQGFESAPIGNFYSLGSGNLTLGNLKVSVTNGGTSQNSNATASNGIVNQVNNNQAYGFNTTAGGSRILRIETGTTTATQTSITFDFTTGVRAFGIFVTDYGNASDASATLKAFVNGSSKQTGLTLTRLGSGNSTDRSVQFFGITQQTGNPLITSVKFQLAGVTSIDRFGFDNVYSTQAVPVPPQVLGSITLAGLTILKKRKQQKAAQAMA
jgi:hypothetical protein